MFEFVDLGLDDDGGRCQGNQPVYGTVNVLAPLLLEIRNHRVPVPLTKKAIHAILIDRRTHLVQARQQQEHVVSNGVLALGVGLEGIKGGHGTGAWIRKSGRHVQRKPVAQCFDDASVS